MTRLNTLLLLVLIGCALSVVTSQHKARKYFTELQVEQEAERKLDSEWRELQIEAQTQGQASASNKRPRANWAWVSLMPKKP